jgi:hypothetical protein
MRTELRTVLFGQEKKIQKKTKNGWNPHSCVILKSVLQKRCEKTENEMESYK